MNNHSIFGTDGIRASLGTYPFTHENICLIGNGIGHWAQEKKPSPTILIADDTRFSTPYLRTAITAGLLATNCTVIDVGTLPSAALVTLIQASYSTIGIMISASHNAYHDNGIKLFTAYGKITTEDELRISRYSTSMRPHCPIRCGTIKNWDTAYQIYYDFLYKLIDPKVCKNMRIILDSANGAASKHAHTIFTHLGAQVTNIHNKPDGYNINAHCGATNTKDLQQAVRNNKADIGFAFDGDADRIIVVDAQGECRDGDSILAMLSMHPSYKDNPIICGTQMTNNGLDHYFQQQNKKLIRAEVGDKAVVASLQKHSAMLGGEPSGHIILRDILPTGDGISTALKIIECLRTTTTHFNLFQKCPSHTINVPITHKKPLTSTPLSEIIERYQKHLQPHGRLLVRYSGTEPKLRILTEAATIKIAKEIAHACAHDLQTALGIL